MKAIMPAAGPPEDATYTIEVDGQPLIILRKNGQWRGYVNQCPHLGVELHWRPNQVLDSTGNFIQCTTHGALFRPEDGFCIEGPCAGQCLVQIEVIEKNGTLYLTQDRI